jgi:hypothetical protein
LKDGNRGITAALSGLWPTAQELRCSRHLMQELGKKGANGKAAERVYKQLLTMCPTDVDKVCKSVPASLATTPAPPPPPWQPVVCTSSAVLLHPSPFLMRCPTQSILTILG